MAMNQVQFQSGLSMVAFMVQYRTEAKCRSVVFRSRWPKGFLLSGLCWARAFAAPPKGADLLSVQRLSASDDTAERHVV